MSPNTLEGLLDDCVDLHAFARGINRHPRTVRRWMNEPDGLPYTWMGKTTIIHIPTAKQWLLSRMRKPNPRTRERWRRPHARRQSRTEHRGEAAAAS